jgi:8-oxo-dGTP pyrophosphatase MutT (NUDIX family)
VSAYRDDVQPAGAVSVVAFDDACRVLLVQRRDDGSWELPTGAMEPGETPVAAASRELFEETGLTSPQLRYVFTHVSPRPRPDVAVFGTLSVAGRLRPSEETSDFVWLHTSQATGLVRTPHAVRITRAARYLGIAVEG